MKEVVVTKEFPGVPDGQLMTRTIKVGEVITGELAKVALANGWAGERDAKKAVVEEDNGKKGKK